MGCRLAKLKKAEERSSPGNIYSTLRRPQVETKVGVAYTYHFLDFLLGKEDVAVSSVLSLSSVRELPVQVRELYSEGFVLVAVHPFVHACGPPHARVQRQLHRAVLMRQNHSWESRELRWCRHRLETDVCVGGNQAADPDSIQSYVKKIQDVAEQGVVFAGFLQQPGTGLSLTGQWDPGEELSSLHSSPSPIHRHGFSPSEGPPSGKAEAGEGPRGEPGSVEEEMMNSTGSGTGAESSESPAEEPPHWTGSEPDQNHSSHNNNHLSSVKSQQQDQGRDQDGDQGQDRDQERDRDGDEQRSSSLPGARWQLFALYNHSEESDPSLRFYSLRVPLQVHREAGLITQLDGHWLDHMTQHFSSGAQLVDGFFHVEEERDSGVALVDGVFIFQSSAKSVSASYDAIVVEQWTVVDGVVVKTDYIPLLQSLAPFGWRLMCVLPTPIVKTNSDGSLSTKQILFLQRPVLPRRRRDFKMNLKSRNKARRSGAAGDLCEESCPSLLEMERLPRRPEEAASQLQTQHQLQQHQHQAKVFFLSPQSREEETDVDTIHTTKQQYLVHRSVRWTDVCHKETRSPAQEPAKSQLFSGVC